MTPRPANPADSGPRIAAILAVLDEDYPAARCTLDFKSPLQLLVSTILSAQCTDERVNLVTPALFAKYPDARAFAEAPLEEIEEAVKSTGFFRNKAKAIKGCATAVAGRFGGEVPRDLETLVALPGIGRKTANVILGNAFGVPAIVVDTHVGRLSRRLGLSGESDPEKVERDLMGIIPRGRWTIFSHQLILHGREVCQARKPRCPVCRLREHCEAYRSVGEKGAAAIK